MAKSMGRTDHLDGGPYYHRECYDLGEDEGNKREDDGFGAPVPQHPYAEHDDDWSKYDSCSQHCTGAIKLKTYSVRSRLKWNREMLWRGTILCSYSQIIE